MTFHKSTPTGPYATRLDTVPHTPTLPRFATGTTDDTGTYHLPLTH